MKLTEDQITTIKSWIESGDDLGKIQNQINESFDINLTYLETRFLLSDLKIELDEEEEEQEPVDEPSAEIQDSDNVSENTEEPEQQEPPSGDLEKEETDESAQPTNINVSVD